MIENTRLAAFADGPVPIDWAAAWTSRSRWRISSRRPARARPSASCRRPRARRRATCAGRRTTPTGSTRRRPCRSSAARRRNSSLAPASPRPTSARGSRRAPGRAATRKPTRAREIRDEGRGAPAEAAHGPAGRRPRGEPGAGRRPPAAVSVAGSILGGFLGRKSSTVGSATGAARGAGRVLQQRDDVKRAEENVSASRVSWPSFRRRSRRTRRAWAPTGGHRRARLRADPAEEGRHRCHGGDAGVRPALAGRRRDPDAGVLSRMPTLIERRR